MSPCVVKHIRGDVDRVPAEMISRMESSVTGQYFMPSFSSLDFGIPEIVIVKRALERDEFD